VFKIAPTSGVGQDGVGAYASLVGPSALGYGAVAMMYRVDLLFWRAVDDESVHEILIRANTYAIVESVEATRDNESEGCLFSARIDSPSPEAALGSVLTVIAQTSEHVGLVDEGSLRRVVIEREAIE
jgi:hypothetical protein